VKFWKALILGGSKILKNLDLNFRHDRNFDLDRNFGRNLTFLHIQKYDASRKRYVSSSFLGRIDVFSGELHFLEGGAKFSIFQSKFKVLKSSIFECFSRFGNFCRSRNFYIGYTKASLFAKSVLHSKYRLSYAENLKQKLGLWRKQKSARFFSGKNDVVLTCKITCTKAYKSVHPEIFGFAGSNQFNWELVPYVSWLSNLYKKQICIFASKSTLRRFVKMKL